jgi:hypothetical protein
MESGMYCAHAVNNTWEENYVHDCTAGAVCSGSSDTFRNNRIERCSVGINLQGEASLNYVGGHVLENNTFADITVAEIDLFTSRFNIIRNQATPVRVKSNNNIEVRIEWTNLLPGSKYILKRNNADAYTFMADAAGRGGVDIVNSGITTYELAGTIPSETAGMIVCPNPYNKTKNADNKIMFANLPRESVVRVYSIAGELVTVLPHHGTDDHGFEVWDISSMAGGVYLYAMESTQQKEKGKVSIIK